MSAERFDSYLTAEAWDRSAQRFHREFVSTGAVHSPDLVRVTIFVQNSDPLFKDMNPVNRFLVMMLHRLGYLDIENPFASHALKPKKRVSLDYRITLGKHPTRLPIEKNIEILPKGRRGWSRVCNYSGVARSHHLVFGGDRVEQVRYGFLVSP